MTGSITISAAIARKVGGAAAFAVALTMFSTGADAAPDRDGPSLQTRKHQAQALAERAFADREDFEFASRGFVGSRADHVIRNAAGQPVWDLSAFDFLKGEAPATVNPSLWRQAQLMSRHGLFRVSPRIWQVRGFDLANITFVKGDIGWIVIDTLGSVETAKAARELVDAKLGVRPIVAVLYTHSHVDHFGGAGGLITSEDARSDKVQVIAPKGFLASAVSENVIAGPAMQRRATYQFGVNLRRDAGGQVNSGIGPGLATGTSSLIAPTREIERTGETITIDGVRMAFQLTPGTEAPAEMNIDFPDWRVVDLAENANATQHNILTPRGAIVRDAKVWAEGLTDSLALFGDSEVLITSHGWPRFGRLAINDYLAKHRDYYAFLHDQTVRLMNDGLNGDEIAARLKLPAALEQLWYDRPYYGSLSFNSRAVYQLYMGWYDANPAHLLPRPPIEAGRRYVAAMGGADKVLALAQNAYTDGDYGWAAELLDRLVMGDGDNKSAKALLARCYDQLGWQSENALWRNIYLTGAQELRDGAPAPRPTIGQPALLTALSTPALFDLLAVRLDADKVGSGSVKLEFVFRDRNELTYVTVENGVLLHRPVAAPGPVDATLTVDRGAFLASVFGGQPLAAKVASGEAKIAGNPEALLRLMSWMDRKGGSFPIVTR